jgi:hypothetical protein
VKVILSAMLAGLAQIAVIAFPPITHADVPGKHPYYLHALSDLRTARWLMEHQPGDTRVSRQEDLAITQIDAAIAEIKRASIDDGKDIHDHTPVDAPNELPGHLRKALELLNTVHADVAREEDDSTSRGLRIRAIGHIDAATHATERAISYMETQHERCPVRTASGCPSFWRATNRPRRTGCPDIQAALRDHLRDRCRSV